MLLALSYAHVSLLTGVLPLGFGGLLAEDH